MFITITLLFDVVCKWNTSLLNSKRVIILLDQFLTYSKQCLLYYSFQKRMNSFLLSWFDSNVCAILRHLSLTFTSLVYLWVNPFHNELFFLKGPIKLLLAMMGIWYSCMNRHLFLKWGTKQLFKEWPIFFNGAYPTKTFSSYVRTSLSCKQFIGFGFLYYYCRLLESSIF
jgi:hypothetical protein